MLLLLGILIVVIGIGLIVYWRKNKSEFERAEKIHMDVGMAALNGGHPFDAMAKGLISGGVRLNKPSITTLVIGIVCLAIGCLVALLSLINWQYIMFVNDSPSAKRLAAQFEAANARKDYATAASILRSKEYALMQLAVSAHKIRLLRIIDTSPWNKAANVPIDTVEKLYCAMLSNNCLMEVVYSDVQKLAPKDEHKP